MTQMIDQPQTTNGESRAITPVSSNQAPVRRREVQDDGPLAFIMDTARFEHLQRISNVMSLMSVLPDHLRLDKQKNLLPPQQITANCFRIVNQACRWGFDPFAMVDETFVVGGKLGYSGKLVAAVVNSRAGLDGRLDYEHHGQGDNRTVKVIGRFRGETKNREIELRLADARTDNQMWRKDPDQKLVYSGVVKWARRYCPEVVLGVLTDDDLERIAATERPEPGSGEDLVMTPQPRGAAALAAKLNAPVTDPYGQPLTPAQKMTEAEAEEFIRRRTEEQRAAQLTTSAAETSPAGDGSSVTDQTFPTGQATSAGGVEEAEGQPNQEPEAPPQIDQLAEALGGDWATAKANLWNCAKEAGAKRSEFESGLAKHVSLVLGKAKKEESIPLAARKAMYAAMRDGQFDYDNGTIVK